MQTRRQSLIEALTNMVIGYVIAVVLTYFIMKWMDRPFTWGESSGYVTVFYVVSMIRSYLLRRLFNRLHA